MIKKRITKKTKFSLFELLIVMVTFGIVTALLCYLVLSNYYKNKIINNDMTETYKKIVNEYYGDVSEKELQDVAIKGMMDYLNEKYSYYLDETNTQELNNTLDGKYHGMGLQITQNENGEVVVYSVTHNTPAEKAGIKENDIIVKVNNVELKNYDINEVQSIIKDSSSANVVIRRNDKEMNLTVKVEDIANKVVTSTTYIRNNKKIGRIYLEAFSSDAYNQFKDTLEILEKDHIDSLIIDVRSNTGGYLSSVSDILNMFMIEGKPLYQLEDKNGLVVTYDTTKEKRIYDVVVLIDSATASASEMLATSMKESYGAIIIGTTSYGKGKVQTTTNLSDDTMIKYTTANWYTPAGNSINEVGITPGIHVPFTLEYITHPSDDTDPQLQKAIDILSK